MTPASLVWAVDLLEPVASVDAGAMAQLQFMLFEAFSNTLQHANAQTLRVVARPLTPQGLGGLLQIIDDGRGFVDAETRTRDRRATRGHQRAGPNRGGYHGRTGQRCIAPAMADAPQPAR
ncbi:MAG: hypothetical protein NTV17_05485 [Burkholderiales bacterium]|nr:hypothetical protein [Burkholderiales bacterium]